MTVAKNLFDVMKTKTTKFSVRHKLGEAYCFEVVESIGFDHQVIGEMFKVHCKCTHEPSARHLAEQMNTYGKLYLPGKLLKV